MKTILLFSFILFSFFVNGQIVIKGNVKSGNGEPLPGVNIFLENTYDGASSDNEGNFSFSTEETGIFLLKATFIGYKTWETKVNLSEDVYFEIVLKESVNTLDAVTITAGSFAASDESRASIMKSLDILTTPTANGDIMAAMQTMPGVQAAEDDGRLLVRGGDVYETQTYIDGLIAAKPYFSKTPDVATRGRFSPSLFSGVSFNSGGYSAEYGQALSSVLVLNSNDLAEDDNTGLSIMSIGGELNKTKRWTESSLMVSGSYTNLSPYDKIFNSSVDWENPVQSANGTAVFRHKTSSRGMLKGYVTTDWGNLSYFAPTSDFGETMRISSKGTTVYSNLSYRDCFSDKSCYKAGISSTVQNNKLGLDLDDLNTIEANVESRFSVFHDISDGVTITWGANETYNKYNLDYIDSENEKWNLNFNDHLVGAFAETEIKFSKNLAIRPGVRTEYSSVINKWNFAPRFAVALKTGEEAQVSGAWGLYHQTPQSDYLRWDTNLNFERAFHYILSYQIGDISKRLFRAEAYYKNYEHLITYEGANEYDVSNLQNDGSGYAGGIDIFWRDQKSIKHLDYWVTYSYIDTKRKYQNYPEKVTPYFVSDHNFSFVGKYWVNKISTQFGLSYSLASGRPYNDSDSDKFMGEKTQPYSDLSLNMSHVFYIGNQYSVLYCSVNNVLGNDNILSYRPSNLSDAQGSYTMIPVKRDLKRMVFIGLFLNF